MRLSKKPIKKSHKQGKAVFRFPRKLKGADDATMARFAKRLSKQELNRIMEHYHRLEKRVSKSQNGLYFFQTKYRDIESLAQAVSQELMLRSVKEK